MTTTPPDHPNSHTDATGQVGKRSFLPGHDIPMVRSLLTMFLISLLCVVVAGACGVWVTHSRTGHSGVIAMVVAGVICLLVSFASFVPIAVAVSRHVEWLTEACLGGSGLRLLLTILLATAVYLHTPLNLPAYITWISIFHFVLLVWETTLSVHYVKQHMPHPHTAKSSNADNLVRKRVGAAGPKNTTIAQLPTIQNPADKQEDTGQPANSEHARTRSF